MLHTNHRIKAVGYARFSSVHQREESISAQKRFIATYAETNNIEIVDWYCDEAKSGKTADRPEFQRMIAKVQDNPDFDMIIVHKLDRLSRNIEDSIKYKRLIEDYGLQVYSLNEGFSDSPNGNFMYNMMSVMNQYYIDNLATEVMKGLRENAYQCKWTGGIPPLGYDVNDEKKLVINEKEAEAVRLIFEMTADGEGYGAIINKLNILGYKTKKGRTFGKNSLYDLLRNERYKGTYIFNKRSKANYQNKRNNHRFKNDDEIIRIENGCPAIVSESLWNRSNAVKKATRCSYTNAKQPYLLTGLLYCAECGAKMHGNSRCDRYGIRSTGYRCSTRTNKHDCNCKEIRCSKLDNFVIDKFKQYFFNDENIKVITENVNQKLNDNSILANECKEVKNNLRTLKVQRNNLADAIAQTGINQTLKDKLNECEDNIAKAEAFIQHCESQKKGSTVTEEDIRKLINELKEYMSDPKSLVTTKFILSQYIERIDVSNETIMVTLKVTVPPIHGGTPFCSVIVHTDTIRRRKIVNSTNDSNYSFIE